MYKAINIIPLHKTMEAIYKTYEKSQKNLILEPFSCVIRICVLCYKDKGTKISIIDNGISYNQPSFSQGLFRSWYGDNREDLHNLCHPLYYFTKWYSRDDPLYQHVYEMCKRGLLILKEVYETQSTINHTLSVYVFILRLSSWRH